MVKKIQQKEEDLDINVASPNKVETFAARWFKTHAVENPEDILLISSLTSRSAEEQFCIYLDTNNIEVYACIFYTTFLTILDFIREKQKRYNDFTISIANSINIGYSNNTDTENEKVGNFMPIMEYIGINRNYIDISSEVSSNKTSTNCIGWKNLNIKQNAEYFKEIQEKAYYNLKNDFKIDIRVSETIIPLFCIFMDHINSTLKMKFQEAEGTNVSEIKINIMGLFDAYYSFNEEENKEIIEYTPNVRFKLALKSDAIAGR